MFNKFSENFLMVILGILTLKFFFNFTIFIRVQFSDQLMSIFGANVVQVFAIFLILVYSFGCSTIYFRCQTHQTSSTKKPCKFGLRNFQLFQLFVGFFVDFSCSDISFFCQHSPLLFFPFSSHVDCCLIHIIFL